MSVFTLALLSQYSPVAMASSDTELNMDFLQGAHVIPSVLRPGMKFPAGQYFVDVVVNNTSTGKTTLTISPEEEKAGALCFSPEWLRKAGVRINTEHYKKEYNKTAGCYVLAHSPYTRADFNFGSQTLVFSIPQSDLLSNDDPARWDYGVNALHLRYQGNVIHQTGQDMTAYGSVDAGINLGRWVLRSNMNGNRNSDGSSDFAVRDVTLSTAVAPLRADLRLGKSWTRNEQFSDFGFYGVSLASNSNMEPWEFRGYAPLITGVAASTSRITITQNGYTVYSRVVQPGPYELNDVRPVGNGDLEVTVEDAGGHKTVTRYPVTTLPTLLRPGELHYDIAAGRKSDGNDISKPFSDQNRGMFWSGSLAYGLGDTTLAAAGILHSKYRAAGINITRSLQSWGALSAGGALSRAEYDDGRTLSGHSISLKYAKSFADSTNLQLMAYRYQSRNYVEFANFDPTGHNQGYMAGQKSRYEMQLSQRLTRFTTLSLSAWREDYWPTPGYSAGGTLGTGFTLFDDVSFFVNAGYNRYPYRNRPDYTASLTMSIPFSLGGIHHYNSTSVSYARASGTQFRTSVSASPTDRLSYNISASASDKRERSVSASADYGFDAIQVGMGLTQSHQEGYGRHDVTSVSGDFSGAVVATTDSGLLLTRNTSDTVGIVRVADVPGVRFNGSPETNSRGYTTVSLSDYSENRIDIDMNNVPDNLDLNVTSVSVVPTQNAVVYREFGANYVKRYFLQVRDHQGRILEGGEVRTAQGLNAGEIARNGVLSMSLLSEPDTLKVSLEGGQQCQINMSGIKPVTDKVQEVRCE